MPKKITVQPVCPLCKNTTFLPIEILNQAGLMCESCACKVLVPVNMDNRFAIYERVQKALTPTAVKSDGKIVVNPVEKKEG